MNSDEANVPQVLPRRPVVGCAPEQVSWLSDRPTPRTFPASRPVAPAGFVPDYSDGVAADSHRPPWVLLDARGPTAPSPLPALPSITQAQADTARQSRSGPRAFPLRC